MADTSASSSVPLASFPVGLKSAVRVSLDEHGGKTFLNARDWYRRRDGSWQPTRRGVTVDVGDLPALAIAIGHAIRLSGGLK